MPQTVHFSYRFYPVGQGLFASGYLMKSGENEPCFTWVYDCGTSSSPKLVTDGIEKLEKEVGDHRKIDLMVLSHFDHDHISGVCELLAKFRIGTLMLPYMPLAQRLVIAFEEEIGTPDGIHTPFFINPVSFLLSQSELGIERILFVPPSSGEGPDLNREAPEMPDDGDFPPELRFESRKPDDFDEWRTLIEGGQDRYQATSIEFLHKGSALTFASYWEFIPYNDDPETEITSEFVAEVEGLRLKLLSDVPRPTRNAALRRLKQAYDDHFGDDSETRNLISLHLYAGPIYPSWRWAWLARARWNQRSWEHIIKSHSLTSSPDPHLEYGARRCSILYTGDGYLDSQQRLRRLITYLLEQRIRSIGLFQVMHHGAEANWHSSVAAEISPLFSIFSSDPTRRDWKHPHAAVVRDFLNNCPVQVDKQRSFQAWGKLVRFNVHLGDVRNPWDYEKWQCPKCGSEMVERDVSIDYETDESYPYWHCLECNEADVY